MLLAITPNPTIDRTLHVPQMEIGSVHRAQQVHLGAGGKGLNVARTALTLGVDVLATGPLAGHAGRTVADLAANEGLPTAWHWLSSGETRTCLLLNHENSDATVINEPGQTWSNDDWQGLTTHLRQLSRRVQAITFSGSLPPGIPTKAFTALARELATLDRPVYIDTSGQALVATLREPAGLCIKMNRSELAKGLGQTLAGQDDLIEAGKEVLDRGAALVVVTLGSAGAIAVAPDGWWQVSGPRVKVVSTVGSGDAFLAGLVAAQIQGQTLVEALVQGVLCGMANATTALPGRFERERLEALREEVEVKHNNGGKYS